MSETRGEETHHPRLRRRWWWSASAAALALVIAFLAVPGIMLYRQVLGVKSQLTRMARAERSHNFSAIASHLALLPGQLTRMEGLLRWMDYWRVVPGVGPKYRDLQEALNAVSEGLRGVAVMMPAMERVAPLLGYQVDGKPPGSLSGRHRISAFLGALPLLVPDLKRAYPDFLQAEKTLSEVHARDFSGRLAPVGHKLAAAQSLLATAVKNMPLIDRSTSVLQNILGDPTPKRYLLIFQNSGELRATGGFMTAYAYVTLDHGKLGRIHEQNMYQLDAQATYHAPASPVIATYLPVTYWHLRDANTSPNVPTTVSYIKTFYDSIPGAPTVNGIIFIDSWFVDQLIGDVGGLTVKTPKGPVQITAADANIKMELMAEGQGLPSNVRKKFIGTMMRMLFADVLHSHGQELARVLKTVETSLNDKFIVLSFNNPRDQALVRRYHWGGVMDTRVPGDYLSIVDENLLGHKDNYLMTYHLSTRIRHIGRRYQETASITYRNSAVDNGWLFVPYKSWVRFYVPVGSQLISMTGTNGIPVEDYVNTTVNKTVFGGHQVLPDRTSQSAPLASNTVTVTYWLPPGVSTKQLTVQLQPGVNHQTLTVAQGRYHKTIRFTHDRVFHF